ncbi:MAG: 7-carboxy-7-deazaguanine synthase QueE [Marinilabiliaceae bacterium]|jgi:organic radical activating enzyme|nr:7-carboxy-7-deazaguanine synthase QueE [Marinilabiliaceae bacterium]
MVKNGDKLPLVEHFYTLQGEGHNTGKAAYFLRIGGCDVGCSWCDSRYSWNPDIHPLVPIEEIIAIIAGSGADSVVVTGGEPLMWNLDLLCDSLKKIGVKTFLETSGAYPLSGTWDWLCLSPKINAPPKEEVLKQAHELKVIIQKEEDFSWAEKMSKLVSKDCYLYLQPEWSKSSEITGTIVEYILRNTRWMISLQSHKYMKIP